MMIGLALLLGSLILQVRAEPAAAQPLRLQDDYPPPAPTQTPEEVTSPALENNYPGPAVSPQPVATQLPADSVPTPGKTSLPTPASTDLPVSSPDGRGGDQGGFRVDWGYFWIGFAIPILAGSGLVLYLLDRRPDLFRLRPKK